MAMSVGGASYFGFIPKPDAEWQRIINKLWQEYGIHSSGSKSLDKQILHEHELREAEKEPAVSNKFLTVTKSEQEKIQDKKKSIKAENGPEENLNYSKGAEIFGKQIFIAIKMKNNEYEQDNRKKRFNKYQT